MDIVHEYHFQIIKQHFSRIALGIELRWGSEELQPYIVGLLQDTREHTRAGFPKHIHDSLMSLIQIHNSDYPQFNKIKNNDPWLGNFSH